MSRKPAHDLRVGTSGWHYAGWWGPFYPSDVSKAGALRYYAEQFNTTELNAPFYRTPTEKAVANWHDSTPDGFRFAWKASKFITHWRRLNVDEHSLELLESRLELMKGKLGPVLFQLPPAMKCNRERLATFLKSLPRKRGYAFEFRHESWYDKEIFALLADRNAALCLSDHADAPAPDEVTADFVYVRKHGTSGRYHGSYSAHAIGRLAGRIAAWRREGRSVWCFFDNDVKSAAPSDARRLLKALADR
jgi:uncharacterized protein YecE (DUF72 family)